MNRRAILALLSLGLTNMMAWRPSELRAAAKTLPKTPQQAEGPYYPGRLLEHAGNSLVKAGSPGTPLRFSGQVLDSSGAPLAGALVEIWQCDSQGIYNHPAAPDTDQFEATFEGFGKTRTNGEGGFSFATIVPVPFAGDPPAEEGRPPHIHVKIWRENVELLTTQLYLEGHPQNATDWLFRRLLRNGRAKDLVLEVQSDNQTSTAWFTFVV